MTDPAFVVADAVLARVARDYGGPRKVTATVLEFEYLTASAIALPYARVHIDGDPPGEIRTVPVEMPAAVSPGQRVIITYDPPHGAGVTGFAGIDAQTATTDQASCLTATSVTYTFDPTINGGSGAVTGRWRPDVAMNLTSLWMRCAFPPSGSNYEMILWDATSSTQKGSTVTLADGVDTESSWTGSVAIDTDMRLWFEVAASVSVDLLVLEAWFDGPGGGGLILYPTGGV